MPRTLDNEPRRRGRPTGGVIPQHESDAMARDQEEFNRDRDRRFASTQQETKRRLDAFWANRRNNAIHAKQTDLLNAADRMALAGQPMDPVTLQQKLDDICTSVGAEFDGLIQLSTADAVRTTTAQNTIPPAMVGIVEGLQASLRLSRQDAITEARRRFPTYFETPSPTPAPARRAPEADAALMLEMREHEAQRNGRAFDAFAFEQHDLPRCTAASRALIEGVAIPMQKEYAGRGIQISLLEVVKSLRRTRPELFEALRPRDESARYVPLD